MQSCRVCPRLHGLQKELNRVKPPLVAQIARSSNAIIFNPTSRGEAYHQPPDDKEPNKDPVKLFQEISKEKKELFRRRFLDESHFEIHTHGSYEYFWKFNSTESISQWIVTSDRDNKEGFSTAHLSLGTNKKAVFYGNLNTTVPKDGNVREAGYCNIRSPVNKYGHQPYKAHYYDWHEFTHIVLRIRGDGRPYHMGISADYGTMFMDDLTRSDQYVYPLFTRGGPYWQIAKVPFSKFYLTSHGRIQDSQNAVMLQNVKSLYFSIMDDVDGPFKLEIDYIALLRDENHTEEHAYELYDHSED